MCYTLCILSPIVPWVHFCACTSNFKLMAPVINLLWVDEYSARCAQYKAISYADSVTLTPKSESESSLYGDVFFILIFHENG